MNKPLKRSPEEFLVALYLSAGMTGNPGKNGKPATNTRYPKIQGSVSEIVHHFSLGIDRNLVQYFWSVEKKRINKSTCNPSP